MPNNIHKEKPMLTLLIVDLPNESSHSGRRGGNMTDAERCRLLEKNRERLRTRSAETLVFKSPQ